MHERVPIDAIVAPVLRARRESVTAGLSRRALLRRALGTAVGLWVLEAVAGTAGFAWSAVRSALPTVRIGTYAEFIARNGHLPVADGFPGYEPAAKAFIVIVDPARGGWVAGSDPSGEGATLNVRALSQRCPHLGCRPNPCIEDFWIHCPCHQSRYDRLGIKLATERYGPAPRGMDRFGIRVDDDGVLFVDTARITLGPLPVALGQPGVLPPLVENGCV